MATTKAIIHKKPSGKYRYRNTSNVLGSWSVTQPTAADIGINPSSSDSYRLIQRVSRRRSTSPTPTYYVKLEKFKYDVEGNPKRVVTTYHQTDADFKLATHAANASLESAFNSGTQRIITETYTNAHAVISGQLATNTSWQTSGLPAGYGGDTTATDSALVAGGNKTDFNSVIIQAPA